MKKTVWIFGLISGAILSAMMLLTLPFEHQIGNDHAEIIGYTTIVAGSLLIYFGVRSYRDTVLGGTIRFGRALAAGALIGVISSSCYVATWEAIYFGGFMPDFLTKYQASQLDRMKTAGASQAEMEKKQAEMAHFAELYRNPLVNVAMTFIEPLPVELAVALISAGLLSRKRRELASPQLS